MSWKRTPDGPDKLEAFFREIAEREVPRKPTSASSGPDHSRGGRALALLLLVLLLAATIWFSL